MTSPGGRHSFVAVQKNESRGCDVEGQAQQGDQQQDRRKDGEFQRTSDLHPHQQNDDGERDIEAQQEIQEETRQGDQHHHQDAHHAHGHQNVGMFHQ